MVKPKGIETKVTIHQSKESTDPCLSFAVLDLAHAKMAITSFEKSEEAKESEGEGPLK